MFRAKVNASPKVNVLKCVWKMPEFVQSSDYVMKCPWNMPEFRQISEETPKSQNSEVCLKTVWIQADFRLLSEMCLNSDIFQKNNTHVKFLKFLWNMSEFRHISEDFLKFVWKVPEFRHISEYFLKFAWKISEFRHISEIQHNFINEPCGGCLWGDGQGLASLSARLGVVSLTLP